MGYALQQNIERPPKRFTHFADACDISRGDCPDYQRDLVGGVVKIVF